MSARIDAMPGSPSADSDRPPARWRAAIRPATPASRSRRTTRRPRKPVPPNTVAVCAGAQGAVIPYRYQSPAHVAADQFGWVPRKSKAGTGLLTFDHEELVGRGFGVPN